MSTGRLPLSASTFIGALSLPRKASEQSDNRRQVRVHHQVALTLVWLAALFYLMHGLDHGWIPHDDGALAQAAERVLHSELPHRDFADIYTGGLSYLNAAAFSILGLRLMVLRYVLLLFALAWIPAVYYCAAHFLKPIGAAGLTLLAVAWTIPIYPAAMPSWYNLFFATFGAAALLRFSTGRRRRWLWVAGVMGGCSILAKIVGLYYLAACLLYLIVDEAITRPTPGEPGRGLVYRAVVALGLAGFVGCVFLLVWKHAVAEHFYHFLLPPVALAALTFTVVRRSEGQASTRCLARLWSTSWPFLLGLSIPIAAFIAPYVGGDLALVLRGIFVSPSHRLTTAVFGPAHWVAIVPASLLTLAFVAGVRLSNGRGVLAATGSWGFIVVASWLIGGSTVLYSISWTAISQAIPLLVVAGTVAMLRFRVDAAAVRLWESCFLLLALAGLCSLVAFPFAAPVYFCYAAPLAFLAFASLLRLVGCPPEPLTAFVAGYYLLFAVVVLDRQTIHHLGLDPGRDQALVRLGLPRGGVLARSTDARDYKAVIDTLKAHARGEFTYAGPDAPEIYFLSGLRNPTRQLFDFLDPRGSDPTELLGILERRHVTAVVINRKIEFSKALAPGISAALATRFPSATPVGRFTVRWRE